MATVPKNGDGVRAARLVDVARLAGVSRATAARALGGYGPVGEETGERVRSVARDLNYRANEVARAMRAGKTSTIGLVIADIGNSFFSYAARAIIDMAARSGYQTLVINTDDDLAKEIDAVRVLVEKRVDGLIVVPSSPHRFEHLALGGERRLPLVLLDRRLAALGAPTITTDDRRGAEAAIELFVARGHSRIGLLVATAAAGSGGFSPKEVVSTVADRVRGAHDGLARAGLTLPEERLRYCRSEAEAARDAALDLLATEVRPTAILATNEEMALGVLAACADRRLAVGHDVSLISFDDSPWAKVFTPAVSVVQRPVYDLGSAAVQSLIREIEGEGGAQSVELPVRLIERQSVRDLNARPEA